MICREEYIAINVELDKVLLLKYQIMGFYNFFFIIIILIISFYSISQYLKHVCKWLFTLRVDFLIIPLIF